MEAYSKLKKQQWLVLICILAGHTDFFQTAVSEIQPQSSIIQLENKQAHDSVNSFELAYTDDHIALFFESSDSKIISQLVVSPVAESDTWKFTDKINYTASTPEKLPLIYIIKQLHKPKMFKINKLQESKISSNATCNYQGDNGCFKSRNTTGINLTDDYLIAYKNFKIISEVEPIINFVIATHEPEIQSVLEHNILDILIYDNLTQIRNTKSAQVFLEEITDSTANWERSMVFSTWYLPIYRIHGSSKSITKFMKLLKLYSNGTNSNHNRRNKTLNDGEFVHIWSEAAGIDLRYLVTRQSKAAWTSAMQIEFEMAQKTFMTYNYSDTVLNGSGNLPPNHWEINLYSKIWNLTLRYSNKHVAYYSDESVPSSFAFPHKILSDTWQYVKETYENTLKDQLPIFYVIRRAGNESNCRTSNFQPQYDFRFVIDCQEVSSKGWDSNVDDLTHLFVKFVGATTFANASVAHTFLKPLKDYKVMEFLDIVVYDIFVGIGRLNDAESWKKTKANHSNNYPQKNTKWFRDWFLPIYINFGQTMSLQRFVIHLHKKYELNLGEFVHFWSGTVRQDLQGLAMETFGWQKNLNEELRQARINYPRLTQLYTVNNSSLPQKWTRNWKEYNAKSNLSYSDEHIACYFDFSIHVSTEWLFKLMSDSWKYAKKEYGPLGHDPILYIHFNQKSSDCWASKEKSYFDAEYGNRNVIDCGDPNFSDNLSIFDSAANKDVLLFRLGLLVLRNARETGNWPGVASSKWSIVNIFVYDIYKGLGMKEDASRWHKQMFKEFEDIPAKNSFWFRDWYFPIYQKYGQAQALNRFLSVVNANLPQEDQDYIRGFNLGEMVHFWSIVVGENLWPLANTAFGCCAWNQKTYLRARKKYPHFNYTDKFDNSTVLIPSEKWIDSDGNVNQDLGLVYVNYYFALYVDLRADVSFEWLFEPISKAWRYAKQTYGPFEPGAIFYLLFLSTKPNKCTGNRLSSYQEKNLENRTVLTCGVSGGAWNPKDITYFMYEIGLIVLKEAKQTGRWPAHLVSNFEMSKIISYDICHKIGNSIEANDMLDKDVKTSIDNPQDNTFWMQNWFYPIYVNYGRENVLNKFLNLLSKHWERVPKGSGYDYVKYLNVGEFVHFWSCAAGVNLMYLANNTLEWNHEYNMQLKEAIKSFPVIKYTDYEAMPESTLTEHVLTEKQFEHSELLVKVYDSSIVTIYYDADVNQAVTWPFKLISKVWSQTRSTYGTVHNTLHPHLNALLHGTKHMGCKASLKFLSKTEQRNVLDCGKQSTIGDAWTKNNVENRFDLILGFAKFIQHSAQQSENKEAYDPKPMSEILAFDILLRLGNFEDAYQLLITTYKESEIESEEDKFWICDWYLPLYTQYGGVAVLNNFLTFLSITWAPSWKSVANEKMNIGQNIHFWSASVEQNLYNFSQLIFGKHQQHQKQFHEARIDFPLLNYSCYDCERQVIEFYVAQNTDNQINQIIIYSVSFSVGFACIVFAALLISLVLNKKTLNRLKQEMRELTPQEIKEFFEGSNKTDDNAHFCIDSQPFNVDYEISRERLHIDFNSALGSGEFGLVYRGSLKPTFEQGEESMSTVVAVKTVKPNMNVTHFKTILTELKVMGYLGLHENTVSLLGAYTVNIRKREVYIALEFCSKGDLLSYLRNNRPHFKEWIAKVAEVAKPKSSFETSISMSNTEPATVASGNSGLCVRFEQDVEIATAPDQNYKFESVKINQGTNTAVDAFSTLDLLKWASQIASGMEFIASRKVIHGDLAARNVLLTEQNVAKISDFGLSRNLNYYAYYMKTSKTPVPWRWMAIESLRDMKFSVQSDAWSFGVVLYEIFSLGTIPYAGWMWDYEFIDKLVAGHRLSAPEFGNESVYKLMMDCMQKEASERITFLQAICRLKEIKVEICENNVLRKGSEYLKLTS